MTLAGAREGDTPTRTCRDSPRSALERGRSTLSGVHLYVYIHALLLYSHSSNSAELEHGMIMPSCLDGNPVFELSLVRRIGRWRYSCRCSTNRPNYPRTSAAFGVFGLGITPYRPAQQAVHADYILVHYIYQP